MDYLHTELIRIAGEYVLAVRGEIDLASAIEFERGCMSLSLLSDRLILDFAEVTFMDSSGIKVLLSMNERDDVRTITIRHPSAQIIRTIEMIGLSDLLLDGRLEAPHDYSDDDVDTFLKVLEGFGHPDRLMPLLDPELTVDDGSGIGTSRSELVQRLRRLHEAGVRGEVVASELMGERMMLAWETTVPDGISVGGLRDGEIAWRILSFRDGRIVNIRHCSDRNHAHTALQSPC